jgi:CheY-like chemotaxis protein
MPAPLVLVVEPNPALRAALVSVLRGAGHHALEAAGAEAAQRVAGVVVPPAVLLDAGAGRAGAALVAWSLAAVLRRQARQQGREDP